MVSLERSPSQMYHVWTNIDNHSSQTFPFNCVGGQHWKPSPIMECIHVSTKAVVLMLYAFLGIMLCIFVGGLNIVKFETYHLLPVLYSQK